MEAWNGDQFWAEYAHFAIGPESDNYRIDVSGYNIASTGGDSLTNVPSYYGNHQGMEFSTVDRDNDIWGENCAGTFNGGWWYTTCHFSKPTGLYITEVVDNQDGIMWRSAYGNTGYSFKFMEMNLVPK